MLLAYPFGLQVLSLPTLSALHLLSAFLILVFLIVHVYMTTTGDTPLSHIKTMITGYEEHQDPDVDEQTLPSEKNT